MEVDDPTASYAYQLANTDRSGNTALGESGQVSLADIGRVYLPLVVR